MRETITCQHLVRLLEYLLILVFCILCSNILASNRQVNLDSILFRQALSLIEGGSYDSANILLEQCRQNYLEKKNWRGLSRVVSQTAELLRKKLSYDSAMTITQEHLDVYGHLLDSTDHSLAEMFDVRGRISLNTGKYKEAFADFTRALDIKLLNDVSGEDLVVSYDQLGDALREQGEDLAALRYYEKQETLVSEYFGPESQEMANVLSDLAIINRKQGRFALAKKRYHKAMKILSDHYPVDHPSISPVYNGLAITYAQTGKYPDALEYFTKVLAIDQKNLDPLDPNLAKSYTNLGILNELMGDLKQALIYFEKSLSIKLATLGKDNAKLMYDYKGLAVIYQKLGDIGQALVLARKAKALEEKYFGAQTFNTGVTHTMLGTLYRANGQIDLALRHLQTAEEILLSIEGINPELGPVYHNLSVILSGQGNLDLALQNAEKALRINTQNYGLSHPFIAGNHVRMGQIFLEKKNYQRARDHFETALDISTELHGNRHQNVVRALVNLSQVSREMGEVEEALTYAQSALIAGCVDFEDTRYENNPDIEDTFIPKDLVKALAMKGRALRARSEEGHPAFLLKAFETFNLASDLISLTQFSYKSKGSVAIFQEELRPVYEEALSIAYLLYQQKGDSKYFIQALHLAEQSRAALLVASINESKAREFSGLPPELLRRENQLRRDLGFYEQQLQASPDADSLSEIYNTYFHLKNEYDKLINTFNKNYPKYFRLKYNRNTIDHKTFQDHWIEGDQALLEFFAGENHFYCLYVDQSNQYFYRVNVNDTLIENISFLSDFLRDRNIEARPFQEKSFFLYNKFITPIKEKIQEKRLTVIPDGSLSYIPFEILVREKSEDVNSFDLPYLFLQHPISYAFSVTFLSEMKAGNVDKREKSFLAFAPMFDSHNEIEDLDDIPLFASKDNSRAAFGSLAGASDEVAALDRFFEGTFFEKRQATETMFKKHGPRYEILHLATHAIIDDINPLNSRLLFTSVSDSIEDGNLYAWELYTMDLEAEMAVLSACNTGTGKMQKGEGVLSIGRAFAYAGCPSVIMSLWPAQDQTTSKIMVSYYENLAKGLAKDVAMQKAKSTYINQADEFNSHPFYWAGFIVQGDPVALEIPSKWSPYLYTALLSLLVFIGGLLFYRFSGYPGR